MGGAAGSGSIFIFLKSYFKVFFIVVSSMETRKCPGLSQHYTSLLPPSALISTLFLEEEKKPVRRVTQSCFLSTTLP